MTLAQVRSRATRVIAGASIATGITAGSLLLALFVAEGLVRVFAPQQLIQIRPDLWQPADTVGHLRRPSRSGLINTGERTVTVTTDADGFRIGAAGRREAGMQVLLMGDSFMEAIQVEHEQTLAHLLERALSDSLRRQVAVRNAGVGGWGPNEYLFRTRQLLRRQKFDLVVVGVFVGNDAVTQKYDRLPPREPVPRHQLRFPTRFEWQEFVNALLAPLNDALETRSQLYILAKNQLSTVRMRLGMTADYIPVEYARAEGNSPRWRTTAGILRELDVNATMHGAQTLFVLIPERFQVYPEEFRRYLRGFGIDSTALDVDQPTHKLNSAMRAEGLHVLDAVPSMRAKAVASGERLYGRVDQHLSPAGHAALCGVVLPEALRLLRR